MMPMSIGRGQIRYIPPGIVHDRQPPDSSGLTAANHHSIPSRLGKRVRIGPARVACNQRVRRLGIMGWVADRHTRAEKSQSNRVDRSLRG